ncbi:DUF3109 family protein [Marinilabiliaceae bacterium ANBcel2]|nr:DUF3109 family protein [Marinilabiliaceae bacterium ANBcel2]
MVQIDNKVISLDLFKEYFVCDLDCCKGACCVEGESGAPLEDAETDILENLFPVVKEMLSPAALKEVDRTGVWEFDVDGDKVTPIIDGRECIYSYYDSKGVCKCVFEKAYSEGKTDFRKPASCYLYPLRITKYSKFVAVNYHKWPVCDAARIFGKKEKVRVYQFLKDPIVQYFGEDFYFEIEKVAKELEKQQLLGCK